MQDPAPARTGLLRGVRPDMAAHPLQWQRRCRRADALRFPRGAGEPGVAGRRATRSATRRGRPRSGCPERHSQVTMRLRYVLAGAVTASTADTNTCQSVRSADRLLSPLVVNRYIRRRRPSTGSHSLLNSPRSSSRCNAGYTAPSVSSSIPSLRSRNAVITAYPWPGAWLSELRRSRSKCPLTRSTLIPSQLRYKCCRRQPPCGGTDRGALRLGER